MVFIESSLAGAYLVDIEKREDDRGFFARAFCSREFGEHGLKVDFVNTNLSVSTRRGTLRGMHYQVAPHSEVKLVRCVRGAIYDVIIDLRPESSTYRKWFGAELSEANHRMLYVPERFAHGFITLTDDVEVTYQVSQFYVPGAERGVRYDDPAFDIRWPVEVRVISEKDHNWPLFESTRGRDGAADWPAPRLVPAGPSSVVVP